MFASIGLSLNVCAFGIEKAYFSENFSHPFYFQPTFHFSTQFLEKRWRDVKYLICFKRFKMSKMIRSDDNVFNRKINQNLNYLKPEKGLIKSGEGVCYVCGDEERRIRKQRKGGCRKAKGMSGGEIKRKIHWSTHDKRRGRDNKQGRPSLSLSLPRPVPS